MKLARPFTINKFPTYFLILYSATALVFVFLHVFWCQVPQAIFIAFLFGFMSLYWSEHLFTRQQAEILDFRDEFIEKLLKDLTFYQSICSVKVVSGQRELPPNSLN